MTDEVHVETRDSVAILTIDRLPANALAPSLRRSLFTQITQAIEHPEVTSIVLCGAGVAFCPGVDLGEYDGPLAAPWVGEICSLIEDAPKPVVVALHGLTLGAGLELALAAHGRVAREHTKIGMPEVTLGLIPGGGATQRLPRVIGAQTTLEILLSGQTVDVGNKRVAPLFDRVTSGTPVEAAIAMAKKLAKSGTWTRTRDRTKGLSDPSGFRKSVMELETNLKDPESAEADILRCIEAAQLLPFDRGLEFEASRFNDRIHSPLARGIRHSFTAVRRARSMPEMASGQVAQVSTVALVGTAPIMGEVALLCLNLGLDALIVSRTRARGDRLLAWLRDVMDNSVEQGSATTEQREAALAKLRVTTDPGELVGADLVLDLGRLSFDTPPILKATAVWAVLNQFRTTSERAAETGADGRIVALRMFRPADTGMLVELAVPKGTSDDAVATIVECFSANERSVIRTVEAPGMLSLNLMAAMTRAALTLVAGGASPFDVDHAAHEMGLATGLFEQLDSGGLARAVSDLENLCAARGEDGGVALELGRAMKSAIKDAESMFEGFYAGTGSNRQERDTVLDWLQAWRGQNAQTHGLPDVGLTTALHGAFVNEAARLIKAQAVLRASDIDAAMVTGFGFDRKKGGPLLQADIIGELSLIRALKKLAPLDPEVWSPHAHLEDMVKYGRRFF